MRRAFFSNAGLQDRLGARSAVGMSLTLSAQVIKLFLQLISIMLLARWLSPEDFGLMAMALLVVGLGMPLMEGGLSMASIQRPSITPQQVSNLFWLNAGLGLVLFVLMLPLAPLAAWVFDDLRLMAMVMALGGIFLLAGVSVQQDALLRRHLCFRQLVVIDLVSLLCGILAALLAAWQGAGYWALVLSPLMTWLIKSCLRWWWVGWWPSGWTRGVGTRSMVSFGAWLSGASLLGYAAKQAPVLMIGWLAGPLALGFFNRAQTLASLPTTQVVPPVMAVLQPVFARLAEDSARFRQALVQGMHRLLLVTVWIALCLLLLAKELVAVLLGPGWGEVVPLLQLLSAFALVEPLAAFVAMSLTVCGQARALMRWKVISLVVVLVSMAIGAFWGLMGIVAGLAFSGLLVRTPWFLWYASRYLPFRLRDAAVAALVWLSCGGVAGCVVWWVRDEWVGSQAWLSLVLSGLLLLLVYVLVCLPVCWLLPNMRADLVAVCRWIKSKIIRKR